MSLFSENFKFLRKGKGYTQDSLALKMGMTRASICAYEDGRALPPYPKLKIISETLGCTVNDLTETEMKILPAATPLEKELERIEDNTSENHGSYDDLKLEEKGNTFMPTLQVYEAPKTREKEANTTHGSSDNVSVPLVEISYFESYILGGFEEFKGKLSSVSLALPSIGKYRAFTALNDFPMPNSVLVGLLVKNASAIEDGKRYLIVSKRQGILYRKVYNQFKTKGLLVLSAEVAGIATIDLPISEIKEVWEVKAFMSYELPNPKPNLRHAAKLAADLKRELDRFKPDSEV